MALGFSTLFNILEWKEIFTGNISKEERDKKKEEKGDLKDSPSGYINGTYESPY